MLSSDEVSGLEAGVTEHLSYVRSRVLGHVLATSRQDTDVLVVRVARTVVTDLSIALVQNHVVIAVIAGVQDANVL